MASILEVLTRSIVSMYVHVWLAALVLLYGAEPVSRRVGRAHKLQRLIVPQPRYARRWAALGNIGRLTLAVRFDVVVLA